MAEEVRLLSVLKHILSTIPSGDRWFLPFGRYVSEIGNRVRGFGADPEAVRPHPNGLPGGRGPSGPGGWQTILCTRKLVSLKIWLPALLIALLVAELFYEFDSFVLEFLAFLATWFGLGAGALVIRKLLSGR